MDEFRLSVGVDTEEIGLLAAELAARINALGMLEAERRIGPLDNAFYRRIFCVVPNCHHGFRAVPTEEFERCLAALW